MAEGRGSGMGTWTRGPRRTALVAATLATVLLGGAWLGPALTSAAARQPEHGPVRLCGIRPAPQGPGQWAGVGDA